MESTNNYANWEYELALFTHDWTKKEYAGFSPDELLYVSDCIQLKFKQILNAGHYPNSEITTFLNLIVKITVHYSSKFAEEIDKNLEEYINVLKKLHEKNKEKSWNNQVFLLSFYVLLGLFLKENWLGKSYLYHDADYALKLEAEEKLKKIGMEDRIKKRIIDEFDYVAYYNKISEDKIESLNQYDYKYLKTESFIKLRSPAMLEKLTVDGEEIFRQLHYMNILIAIREFIKNGDSLGFKEFTTIDLWRARLNFLHNKILNERMTSLQETVIKQYDAFFKDNESILKKVPDVLAALKVEHGNVYLYYYKYKKSLRSFNEAQELRNLQIKITGMLGVRTKYQSFLTAQLVVEAEAREEKRDPEDEKFEEDRKKLTPQNVQLDEECILLEKPKLADLNESNLKRELSVQDQMIILSLIYHLQRTNPKDDILQEQVYLKLLNNKKVSAYLGAILDKSKNWLVYSMALYVRSLNELARWKTKERSLLQLQTLIDQFNDKQPGPYERLKYYYSLYYPSVLELQKTLAEKYMETGMVMSSCQLFERLDMIEESIECLAMAGRNEDAKKKAKEIIETKPTPKIYCLLGEMTGDVSYFKQSWKLSKKKFARAKRVEGNLWFSKGDFAKAIKAFKKALGVNAYNASTWFTLGCCYLKTKSFHEAAQAFGRVVSIDESQGEAWANMASALTMDGKKLEAFNALQQAVKYNENSWRIWQNFMMVALESKKFKAFMEGIERLIVLNHGEVIDDPVLVKLNKVFEYQISIIELDEATSLAWYRKRISDLYKLMSDKLATKPFMWNRYQLFVELNKEYNVRANELLKELESKTDLSENYIKHVKGKLQEQYTEHEINELIANLCLKECHSIMIVGWEIEKKQCALLEKVLPRLQEAYAKCKDEKMDAQLKLFLNTNVPTINKALYDK